LLFSYYVRHTHFYNRQTKNNPDFSGLFFVCQLRLFGSANGACAFARAAIETCICVDFVNTVFFGNSANRASISASAATDASIFVDLVCHNRNSVLDGTKIM
jgi:hypothetical protein